MASRYVLATAEGADFPLGGSITVGRHLDNDLVVAGEDVRDFHVRLEVSDRGPKLHLLRGAVVQVNGTTLSDDAVLVPGDELTIGQDRWRIVQEVHDTERMEKWSLYGFRDAPNVEVGAELTIGRHPSSTLLLVDAHVSRHHGRIATIDGTLWLEDFGSANGTFLNGRRVDRAARLLHGDEIAFDTVAFQVIANGRDLTPVRWTDRGHFPADALQSVTLIEVEDVDLETTELSLVGPFDAEQAPEPAEPGCYLFGIGDAVRGRQEVLRPGRYTIGRGAAADIVVDHPSISERHAEINLRSEGCYVSDLMSKNGVHVNGEAVQSEALGDGDVVAFGAVHWVFRRREAPPRTNKLANLLRFFRPSRRARS